MRIATAFAERGYVVAAIDYRTLASSAPVPRTPRFSAVRARALR